MLVDFVSASRRWAERRDVQIQYPAQGNNTIRILRGDSSVLLYVKLRAEPPGSWGLTKTRLDEFAMTEDAWAIVLLVGSARSGYFVPGTAATRRLLDGRWSLAHNGDYEVTEDQSGDQKFAFTAVEECMERALAKVL